ncbi:SDR family oxidoreductase [Parendozoicomonas haliclonae]|uniref:Gluconate 5-dehydrogenase n=1 Tax=Parendozoicomonas haliclonae TaxID=1960125 RepID=A0A1X7AG90_9GAMM|nr:SDR family oxidoreductase [Parendozoicomonas haliclonae]SMA38633.1 Gluconate 5-dehydrogenase [Parendozoicomonas haliclonae]
MSKTILITGAGSGFGLGAAIGLAKKGHKVIAGVYIYQQVTVVKQLFQDEGLDITVMKLDVNDRYDHQRAWEYDIDILVNVAGTGATGPIAEIPVDYCREVMETNIFGPLELTQGFVPAMVKRGSGKIFFVSSMAGLTTYPFLAPYNASKHAMEAIVQCMKDELKDFGIRVATFNPGAYRTGFNDRIYEQVDEWYDPKVNFTKEGPIRDIQKLLAGPDLQIPPQSMIDMMVDVIPSDEPHPFRNMLPPDIVDWCKDYQKRMWEEMV